MNKEILNSILFLSFSILIGCKSDNVEGIILENTLVVHQSFSENRRMESLIKSSLDKESNAFNQLIHFPNGGGESSYNFGFVITQIIYKNNDDEIIKMIRNYDKKDIKLLESYIAVGLEYGDNNYDGNMDESNIKDEFPRLFNFINNRIY
ncbi:DUF1374 domain-containing protein [Winogradskyella sp. 4-2091]|uniref:DUF1374 domain-containing protein n=1 Tax=Winogradskyella sp. 4-2091 TaxID=3381659 RepID=UPI003891DEA3